MKHSRRLSLAPALVLSVLGVSSLAHAQVSAVPSALNFQGRLATPSGNPVPNGSYSVRFSLWDAASSGTEKWNKTVANVAVKNGTFAVTLDTFPAGTFNGNLWLEVKIGSDAALSPRTSLVSVPYAMKSDLALTVPDGSLTAAKFASGALNTAVNSLAWLLGGNAGTNPASQFVGTTDNQPLVFKTNNAERLRIDAAGNVIAVGNFVVDGANSNTGLATDTQLRFGWSGSGEGIGSKRSTGVNQYGLDFYTLGSLRMSVTANGNVGIGTVTPVAPLSFADVLGNKISLWGQQASHYGIGIQPSLLQLYTPIAASDIAFGYGSSAAMTETMRIKGSGNVGIGTAAPSAKLDVNGTARITGFQMPTGAGAGKVLVSDASGTGTWGNVSVAWSNITGIPGRLGGVGNFANGNYSLVAGGNGNTANGDYSLVAGGNGNTAGGLGSTIVGGFANGANGNSSFIGGGDSNTVDGGYSAIGGGSGNYATSSATIGGGSNNYANRYSTIAGGSGNFTGDSATIGGGGGNEASGNYSTIAGGRNNIADNDHSVVGGGYGNYASGQHSTIAGGTDNYASEPNSTIAGGSNNYATGLNSIIAGGIENAASGDTATIGGGYQNTASGHHSTVAGGDKNTAAGDYSFAAGRHAVANHLGTFVWQSGIDGTPSDFASTADGQFLISAYGGVGINTNNPLGFALNVNGSLLAGNTVLTGTLGIGAISTAKLHVRGGVNDVVVFAGDLAPSGAAAFQSNRTTSGTYHVELKNSGSTVFYVDGAGRPFGTGGYVSLSDARYKHNVVPIENALDSILSLRGVTYEWDTEKWKERGLPTGRQIGFIAQEVEKVLPEMVTTDSKGYKMVSYTDAVPVLVEAVKAQQKQMAAKDVRLNKMEAENAELKARLNAIERTLAELKAQK